jgi:hypothetical protein
MARPQGGTSPAAVALALGCLAASLAAAVVPQLLNAGYDRTLAAQRELAAARERLARAAGGQATTSGIEVLLAGNTPGSIAADLQRRMMAVAGQSGTSVRSLQIDMAPVERSLLPATADIALQATTDTLQALIHAIEAGAPLLFVEDVTIQRAPVEAAAGAARRAALLDVTMKVKGFGTASVDGKAGGDGKAGDGKAGEGKADGQ